MMKRLSPFALALGLSLCGAAPSQAALIFFTNPNVGDFVPNTATPAFLAAIGGSPDEFISFSTLLGGAPAPLGTVNGSLFSNNVVFRTGPSAANPLGSPLVEATGPGTGSEIGPVPGFNGVLVIDFLAAGQTATAVGFGPVEFGTGGQIRIFDENNVLIATQPGVSDSTFTFFGVVSTGPERIGRIELQEPFYAIQDIQFDLAGAAAVPEPSSMALIGLGAAGLLGYRRSRRQTA